MLRNSRVVVPRDGGRHRALVRQGGLGGAGATAAEVRAAAVAAAGRAVAAPVAA
uniref:Uncharacterized protein n=1 Tax=Anopheles dirus TaxID=7168 RepID=A0A182NXH9_9DIPT